jgi:hypothetical protein
MVHLKTLVTFLIAAALGATATAIPPTGLPTMEIDTIKPIPQATPLPPFARPHGHKGPKPIDAAWRLVQAKQRGGPGRNVNEQERQARKGGLRDEMLTLLSEILREDMDVEVLEEVEV